MAQVKRLLQIVLEHKVHFQMSACVTRVASASAEASFEAHMALAWLHHVSHLIIQPY